MSRRGNRLGHVVVALWLGVHAVALLRALPLPAPLGGRLPWRMFLVPSGVRVEIVAEGLGADGGWTPIALRRLFRFSRGATDEPLYEESEVLAARGRTGERAAFARWIAGRLAEEGTSVRAIRFSQRRNRLSDGAVRVLALGRYEVGGD